MGLKCCMFTRICPTMTRTNTARTHPRGVKYAMFTPMGPTRTRSKTAKSHPMCLKCCVFTQIGATKRRTKLKGCTRWASNASFYIFRVNKDTNQDCKDSPTGPQLLSFYMFCDHQAMNQECRESPKGVTCYVFTHIAFARTRTQTDRAQNACTLHTFHGHTWPTPVFVNIYLFGATPYRRTKSNHARFER
jgi:hypothetical protein